jgi:hypothetical protein
MASQRQSLPLPYTCVHACASPQFDHDSDTSSSAHLTAGRTERSSGARTRIVGSGTFRRKARLDGRHTSVGGRAVAAVRSNQIKSTSSWARPDFSPRLEGRVPQQGEGVEGSPCASGRDSRMVVTGSTKGRQSGVGSRTGTASRSLAGPAPWRCGLWLHGGPLHASAPARSKQPQRVTPLSHKADR